MVLLLSLSALVFGVQAGGFCCQGSHYGDAGRCYMNDGVTPAGERAFMQSEKRAGKIWSGRLPGSVGGRTPAERADPTLLKCCKVTSCCHVSRGNNFEDDGPHISVHCSQRQPDGSYEPWRNQRHINCVTGANMGGGNRRLEDVIEAELFAKTLPQQADHVGQLVAPLARRLDTRRRNDHGELKNAGKECFYKCKKSSGLCDFCGSAGKCCRKGYKGGEKGCEKDEGGKNRHECIRDTGGSGGCIGADRNGDWCKCRDGLTTPINVETAEYLGGNKNKYHVDNIGKELYGCYKGGLEMDIWDVFQGVLIDVADKLDPRCRKLPPIPVDPPVYQPTQKPRDRERERERQTDRPIPFDPIDVDPFGKPKPFMDPRTDLAIKELQAKAVVGTAAAGLAIAAVVLFNVAKCAAGLTMWQVGGFVLCVPSGRRLEGLVLGNPADDITRRLGALAQDNIADYLKEAQESTSMLELNGLLENMMEMPTGEIVEKENSVLEKLYGIMDVPEETKTYVQEYLDAFSKLAEYDINLATVAIDHFPPWSLEEVKEALPIARANPDPVHG